MGKFGMYARSHRSTTALTTLPISAMEAQWSSLKEQIQAEALHRSNVSSNLELQALQPLQVYMLVDLEKRFRMVRGVREGEGGGGGWTER